MLKFGVAVIYYQPEGSVLDQLDIFAQAFPDILAVDNSEGKTKVNERISAHPKVTYLDMGGNQGMSMALNRAFEWAGEQGIDYLLTMDQDSRYPLRDIKIMERYIERKRSGDVAVYGSNYYNIYWDRDGKKEVAGPLACPRNKVKEIPMCLTSGSFVNVKIIRKILPLKDLFIAYVDNAMSEELRQRGYRLVRVGAACFAQQVGMPVRGTWLSRKLHFLHHTEVRYYYLMRNTGYYRDWYGKGRKNRKVRIRDYVMGLRIIFNILAAEPGKIKKLKACYAGILDHNRGVLGKIPLSSITWL